MSRVDDDEVDVKQKRINGGYLLSGLVMLIGALLVIIFCSVRLVGYLDYKDFEEGTCLAMNQYQYFGSNDLDEYKIWCSCNDDERNEDPSPCSSSTSGSFDVPCMRLNVTIQSTGHHTWLRNTYHLKGRECTNCCKHRTIGETHTVGQEYRCWYNPNDPSEPAVPRKYYSSSKMIHSLLWPCVVFVAGFVGLAITFVCHMRYRKSGSQSYS